MSRSIHTDYDKLRNPRPVEKPAVVCAACPDFLEQRDLRPGDFCTVHWSEIQEAVPKAGFHCEHHDHTS